jgi:hypothetical protein
LTFFEGWGQDPAQVQEIAPTAMRRCNSLSFA